MSFEDRTPKNPDKLKKDPNSGYYVVDEEESEIFHILGGVGLPDIYYAVKANKYFKDPDAKNVYTDAEIQALDLPIPIQIKTARDKMIREIIEKGGMPDSKKVWAATAPGVIKIPKEVQARLKQQPQGVDLDIARLNRVASKEGIVNV